MSDSETDAIEIDDNDAKNKAKVKQPSISSIFSKSSKSTTPAANIVNAGAGPSTNKRRNVQDDQYYVSSLL